MISSSKTALPRNLICLISNLQINEGLFQASERKGDGVGAKISGGSKGDYIHNCNERVKINAGGGNDNDTIENDGANVTIYGNAGEDSLRNISNMVTISGGNDTDEIYNSGKDVTIDGGKGKDTILNVNGKSASLDGNSEDDFIYNGSGELYYEYVEGNRHYIEDSSVKRRLSQMESAISDMKRRICQAGEQLGYLLAET